ncbi:MAG TPA: hypothetical protein PLQ12_05230 [Candidatus Defluviicoccus seviourii]|nr:hypothetical protein [Candidatus Defluviicoccus seviourii]
MSGQGIGTGKGLCPRCKGTLHIRTTFCPFCGLPQTEPVDLPGMSDVPIKPLAPPAAASNRLRSSPAQPSGGPATACTADALAPAEGSVPQPFVSPTPPTAGQLPRHPAANGHPDRTAPLGQPRTLPVAYVLLGAAGLFALAGIAALILILTGSPPFSHTQRPSPSTTDPANSVSAPAPLSTPRPAPPKAASPEPSPVTAPLPFPLPPRPYAEPARPSFDCAKARLAVEILICNDVELAALDRVMAEKYRVLRETMSSEGRQQLKKDQLSWLAQRNACASRTDAQRCVKDRYFTRIADLQGG